MRGRWGTEALLWGRTEWGSMSRHFGKVFEIRNAVLCQAVTHHQKTHRQRQNLEKDLDFGTYPYPQTISTCLHEAQQKLYRKPTRAIVRTPSIALKKPYNTPLYNPLYNLALRVLDYSSHERLVQPMCHSQLSATVKT